MIDDETWRDQKDTRHGYAGLAREADAAADAVAGLVALRDAERLVEAWRQGELPARAAVETLSALGREAERSVLASWWSTA